ncbi:MAG: hypothetical protein RIS36_1655 [Pseudomonadota bacterium]
MRVVHRYQSEQMNLELSISDDKLKLFAKAIPQQKYFEASEGVLIEELRKVTQEELIDRDVVRDIIWQLHQERGCEGRRVAKGEPAILGRDGKVVWLVRRFRQGGSVDSSRELADFYNLGLFENIEAGREVARVYKPTEGRAGVDVTGTPIPSKAGKPVTDRFDKSLEFKPDEQREDYQTLLAAVSGYAHEESGRVSIRDVLVIAGNLDYEMGHIDFIGGVRVGGDVQKGFHIKARGDIEIVGSVLGENQLTSEASVSIRGFHQGGEGAMLRARVNYSVSICQNVTADVGGNITILKEARDCSFRASAAVMAPQARIVGGTIWCVKGLEVKALGNSAGVRTTVELRNELEVTPEYRRVEESIKRHEVAVAALELHIGPYLQNRKRVPLLAAKFKQKISELLYKYDGVQASLAKLQESLKHMRESKPMEESSRINILGMAHSGVVLSTSSTKLEFHEDKQGPVSFKPQPAGGAWASVQYEPLQKG